MPQREMLFRSITVRCVRRCEPTSRQMVLRLEPVMVLRVTRTSSASTFSGIG